MRYLDVAAALRSGERLRAYAVNPKYDNILGAPCFPSVADLPEAPDLIGVVVPQQDLDGLLKYREADWTTNGGLIREAKITLE